MTGLLRIATVTEVVEDGVKLQFGGELTAREKVYSCVSCSPETGDRLCVAPVSGTHLVLGVIGGAGAGGGDVTGPAGATAGNLAALDATGKVLSDSGIAAADVLVNSEWIAPTLENSWHNYGYDYRDVGYIKIGDTVILSGTVDGGANNAVIFTLPVGYRPAAHVLFCAFTNGNYFGRIDVFADGTVVKTYGNTGWVSLDGVHFSTV